MRDAPARLALLALGLAAGAGAAAAAEPPLTIALIPSRNPTALQEAGEAFASPHAPALA